MDSYLCEDEEGDEFVIVADEASPGEGHGLAIGTRVVLAGLPRRVRFAPPPEPQWRRFDVIDGPEAGDWRNLDARHVAPAGATPPHGREVG